MKTIRVTRHTFSFIALITTIRRSISAATTATAYSTVVVDVVVTKIDVHKRQTLVIFPLTAPDLIADGSIEFFMFARLLLIQECYRVYRRMT